MEYCPYGQLYEVLRDGKEIPPTLVLDWAKQIASGMSYLHSHKIIHRDLKSPNVLVASNDVVKISDFGTSREWNEKSTKMSFAGTVAWMAPEVIRNEMCSEKVDIWSYGVVLWELLIAEIPYKDVDSSAIIWGVGSNSLHLPVPSACPEGFKLLMRQCWSAKPRNRPSFRQILMHLEIASCEILSYSPEKFVDSQAVWREEIQESFQKMKAEGSNLPQLEEELIRRRKEELRHAQDVREHYERKLERANNLYMELTACMLQLEKRERELIKREQQLMLYNRRRKSIVRPIIKAQEKLDRLSKKRPHNKPASEVTTPDSMKNTEGSSMTTSSERVLPSPTRARGRKSRHRRNNSRGSVKDIISPVRSPSQEGLHDGRCCEHLPFGALHHVEHGHHAPYPGTFKFLGPGTAIREQRSEDEVENSEGKTPPPDSAEKKPNLSQKDWSPTSESSPLLRCSDCSKEASDYYCKCGGGCCGDTKCQSKRSSRINADVENSCDTSPLPSPRHLQIEMMHDKSSPDGEHSSRQDTGSGSCSCSPMASPADVQFLSQSNSLREKDSNENLNYPVFTSDNYDISQLSTLVPGHENSSTSDYYTMSDTLSPNTPRTSYLSGSSNQLSMVIPLGSGVKRAHSNQDMTPKQHKSSCRRANSSVQEETNYGSVGYDTNQSVAINMSPNLMRPSLSSRAVREANTKSPYNSASRYRKTKRSEDSWSEDGELSDDEESLQQPPCRQSSSAQSSEGVFSEEDSTSDLSATKDLNRDAHLSTGSTENLEAELSKCMSDGLSDREKTVQRMKNKVTSTDGNFEITASDTSIDSDECSDMTVSSAVFLQRSLEGSIQW